MPVFGRRLAAFGLLLFVAFGAAAQDEVAVPPVARVTDLTDTLSAQQQASLDAKLAAFEHDKGPQLAVLILPTTQPETIEQYGIRVGDAWKLGRKGVDDGAILIVAKNDHRLRIEVGYGLEGALNDATSERIISETIVPLLRRGRWNDAINAGVDQMISVAGGEPLPPPKHRAARSHDSQGGWIFPVLIIAFVGMSVMRRLFGRFIGAGFGGGLLAFVIYLLTAQLIVAGVVGLLAFLFALLTGFGGGRGGGGWGGGGWGGGLGGGGFGGGGFGGGGFGGGGFSGGGGGFGGGGASGSW